MTTFSWILPGGILMRAIALVGSVTLVLSDTTLQKILLPLVSCAAGSLVGGALFTRFRRRWSPCRSGRRSGGWRWDS
jgi:hypothetical protein